MTPSFEATRIAKLEADNARLRRLLDARDAPQELRHRLNSTLSTLKTIVRVSAETRRDLDDYVAHIEDRIHALIRARPPSTTSGLWTWRA